MRCRPRPRIWVRCARLHFNHFTRLPRSDSKYITNAKNRVTWIRFQGYDVFKYEGVYSLVGVPTHENNILEIID
jgi:hypothetical protein